MNQTKNIFQQKLENHQVSIDGSFWADMEKRLSNKERKKSIPLWWWIGGVAASLALLVVFLPFFKTEKPIDLAQNLGSIIENNISENETKNIIVEPVINNFIANKSIKKIVTNTKSETEQIVDVIYYDPEINKFFETVPPENNENIVNSKEIKAKPQDAKIEERAKIQTITKKPKAKQPFSLALAANFPSENTKNIQNETKDIPGLIRVPAQDKKITIEQILQDYPEENHLPPLSVGISFRTNINRYFAVETGFTYTYLNSTFNKLDTWGSNNEDWARDYATLKQHYIGIPLNAVVNIIDNKKWNFYLSLGGMVEKGVWLDYYRIKTYSYTTQIWEQGLQEKIPGLQWSAAAALGASYKLHNNVSLYLEPKFNYYFDCNQPRSFRTMSPFNIGINGGLRFMF